MQVRRRRPAPPIGLAGRKNAGKDTAADTIAEWWTGEQWTKASFADPIRCIGAIFGYTREQMLDPAMKEKRDKFWNMSFRNFAQKVGTDLFRRCFDEDVWVKLAERELLAVPDVRFIFTDVRFPNEADMIHRHGGTVIEIVRPGLGSRKDWHASEHGLPRNKIDHQIVNDGPITHFMEDVCRLVEEKLY